MVTDLEVENHISFFRFHASSFLTGEWQWN